MPVDPNIILGVGKGVTPLDNPIDTMNKGLQFQNLAMANAQARQEFQDNQAMRSAMGNNTSVDKEGNTSVDQQGVLKELAQTSPSAVMKAAQGFAQQKMALQQQKLENQSKQAQFIGQLAGGVTDQASMDKAMATAQAAGIDTSGIDKNFDPDVIKHLQGAALTADQQAKNQIALLGEQNKKRDLDMQYYKTFGSLPSGNGPGGVPGKGNGSGYTPPDYAPAQNGKPEKLSSIDPSTLIKNVPEAMRAPVAKEEAHAANVAAAAPELIESHNLMVQAAKDNHLGDYLSAKNRYTQAVRTANQDITDANAKEATIKGIVESTAPGLEAKASNDYTNSQKTVRQWIGNEKASPNATASGINFSQYSKTHVDPKLLEMPGDKSQAIQQSKSKQSYSPDVTAFASKHGISPEQAQSIKAQRMQGNKGSQANGT